MQEKEKKKYINKKEKGAGKYRELYREGIELLQTLSGGKWTDYNEHDPGVTILENVLYAMTDLSYKTDLPIQDILTEGKGEQLQPGDNGFFTPSEIMTSNPVTPTDLRKLFIDRIINVKDVWIEPQHYCNHTHEEDVHRNALKGLYHIFAKLYSYPDDPKALKKEESRVINKIREIFHAHRNLCEDLYDIVLLKPFPLRMQLKVTLDDNANGEEVFANIYYRVNDYLSHEVRFRSLRELRKTGKTIADIFNGPLLENGFIEDRELKERMQQIVPSDVIKLIVKVEDVISVDFFELSYEEQGEKKIIDEKMAVPHGYTPTLTFPFSHSEFVFENRGVMFTPDLKKVKKQISYIEAMYYGSFRSVSRSLNTIDFPEGKNHDIAAYYPVKEQFPLAYGIGKFGLPEGLPPERYAQARQLQAYLLPMDQLMNNFLAQLTNIYTLYDADNHALQSYFYSELDNMPELKALICKNEDEEASLENWKKVLQKINSQFDRHALIRLNEATDSLLARYNEEFPDYFLKKISNLCYGKKIPADEHDKILLGRKKELLRNYADLSYNKAKSYNYKQAVKKLSNYKVADPDQKLIPGVLRKIAVLLNIEDISIRSLSRVITEADIKIYKEKKGMERLGEKLEVIYSGDKINIVAVDDIAIVDESVADLRNSFYYLGNAEDVLQTTLREGVLPGRYEIKETKGKSNKSWYVVFKPRGKDRSVVHITASKQEAREAIRYATDFLLQLNKKSEGMYLIEHMLLAPPYHGNNYGFSFEVTVGTGDEESEIKMEQPDLRPYKERNLLADELISSAGSRQLQSTVVAVKNEFIIRLLDEKGKVIARSAHSFVSKQLAEDLSAMLLKQLNQHLTSHHIAENLTYYAHYGKGKKVDETFYSLQMSFILPAWPVRFQNENFRHNFNRLSYGQTPAHIAFGSYWLDLKEMIGFEENYFRWFGLISNNKLASEQMEAAYELIRKIKKYQTDKQAPSR